MHTAAGHPRAPRALLIAVLLVIGALGLLPRLAAAQDCSLLNPCENTTTSVSPSTSTTEDATTTTGRSTGTTVTRSTREEVTTSTLTVTTLHNVLIPGNGTAGAESTTTTAAPTAGGSSGLSDQALIMIIVAGLAVVAVTAGLLTWRYWSATRPRVVEALPTRPGRSARSAFLD